MRNKSSSKRRGRSMLSPIDLLALLPQYAYHSSRIIVFFFNKTYEQRTLLSGCLPYTQAKENIVVIFFSKRVNLYLEKYREYK